MVASRWGMAWVAVATVVAIASDAFGADDAIPPRVKWTTSKVIGSPEPPSPYQTVPVFTKLPLEKPLYVRAEPGNDSYLAVEHQENKARLIRFRNDPEATEREILLEPNRQLYAVTFHPRYVENGYIFLLDNGPSGEKPKFNRIVRYTIDRQPPHKLLVDSEHIILEWESDGHNGGEIAFGPDGLLYCPTGDGTSDSDPLMTGQGVDDLLSVLIRIDVDHPAEGKNYAIPPDNPFIEHPDARPEIWAFGFRNPWRIDIDPVTGHIWITQNGQDLWEQVYLVRRGENYGWSVNEGSYPFYPDRKLGPGPIIPPTAEHHHAEARSLTGGVVYRGTKLPDLDGTYVYGDYSTGRIWGIRHDGEKVTWHQELVDTPFQITGFTQTPEGDLLVVDLGSGLHRIEPRPPATEPQAPFPRRLSETGLFSSVAEHRMADGVIAYSVNAPLWSDGAAKERFLALPDDTGIEYHATNAWKPDEGTVLVKTFALETQPGVWRRVETRLMHKLQGEWVGYSYCWDDEQTDAILVEKEGADTVYTVVDPTDRQRRTTQTWHFPSRTECLVCHSRASGFVLGLQTSQMNRVHDYGEFTANQIKAFDRWKILRKAGSKAEEPENRAVEESTEKLAKFVDPNDATAPLEARVRAYLHVNCSVCHQAAGGGNAQMDLLAKTPLDKMKVIDEAPLHAKFEVMEPRLVAPGDPDRSVLLKRVALRGRGQMPPLGTNLVDPVAVELLNDWIRGLPPQKETTTTSEK